MSLEQALDDERKLLADVLERQSQRRLSGVGRGRPSARDLSEDRSHSRGLSNVRRLSMNVDDDDDNAEFSICNHDPSERLKFPESGDKTASTKDDGDSYVDDVVSIKAGNQLTSEEEQISDTDNEFIYDDGGSILPNYATYSTLEKASGSSTAGSSSNKLTVKEEEKSFNNHKVIENARKAEKLDEILAAERGLANAKLIGSQIPREVLQKIQSDAEEAGTKIDITNEIYQEDKDRKEKLKGYAIYKKKLVSPKSGSIVDGFTIPYTSDIEEKIDSELAKTLNEKVDISEIDSNNSNARAIRTITRGNFFELLNGNKNPKSFILCLDFSDESIYALEWCIGTILVDGSVLYILNVIEDDDYSSMNLNGIPSSKSAGANTHTTASSKSQRDKERINNVERVTKSVLELLKMTKLQVHIVIESVHHPIPRHFMVEIIHHISPTLVIVGSKGNSAIKGVLLGSLSNYLIRKSSSPVMVVKNKLKKLPKKGKQFSNNISTLHSLAEAKVD